MKINIYLHETCGSFHELHANLDRAAAELGIKPEMTFHALTDDDAVSRNIKGSPSIWINRKELFEGEGTPGVT